MTKIETAIRWLREGHKIRRPSWNESAYLVLRDDKIVNDRGDLVKFSNINSLEAIDWLVYKKKKI